MTVDFFKNIINSGSQELKYKQIIEAVTQAVQDGSLAQGEILPSVNEMSKGCVLSRDTVLRHIHT